MTDENDELLGMFVQEAAEHLETIEPDLLTLEEKGSETDQEIVNRLFRGIHSIKGSAGFFGLTNITRLSHTMENLMGRVRDHTIEATPVISDSLLAALDKLKQMIGDVSNSETIDAKAEVAAIEAILNNEKGATTAPAKDHLPASPLSEDLLSELAAGNDTIDLEEEIAPEPAPVAGKSASAAAPGPAFNMEEQIEAVVDAITHGRHFFIVTLNLPADAKEKVDHVIRTRALLSTVGTVVASDPDVAEEPSPRSLNIKQLGYLFSTVLEADLLAQLLQVAESQITPCDIPPGVTKIAQALVKKPGKKAPPARTNRTVMVEQDDEAEEVSTTRPRLSKPANLRHKDRAAAVKKDGAAPAAGAASGSTNPSVEETLRVSVSLLDELINNAGELVLARNQILRATSQVITQFPQLGPLVQNLDSITSRIQERVMQARMQPVSVVFNKFPRIIRDLARKLDKKIDLNLRGGEVELDKSVIEHLSDPLTHMIRNVADHGIETPQDRIGKNKQETGQVELAAYHENGMVNISLSDDGAGIDPQNIKMKALKKGVITEHQADVMSEQDALTLIFAPGFSTAEKVSDVSGRGVGMDVVRTNIEKLGGTVHVESKVGKGTRIILKLPLTLAIIPAMIVSSGEQRFAVPEVGLVEIVRITESDRANQIEMVGNAPVLRLRNALLPLVDLSEVLTIERFWPKGSNSPDKRKRLSDRRAAQRKAQSAQLTARKGPPKTNRRDDNAERRDPAGLVAYVMVINVGGNEFGMVVDEVLDSEEIVVKPIPSFFKDNPCFSATTILGDGSVALIIDYAGVMESAKINFSSVERAHRVDLDAERRNALRERQNIILLKTNSGIIMGIVHGMIRRVEKISRKLLETIGGTPYVRYDGRTFRAVYPDQVLGLDGMGFHGHSIEEQEEDLCMVVPNIPGIQAGLIFTQIIDTRETNIDMDSRAIKVPGLFGSTQIDDRVVLFPDIYAVLDQAGITSPQLHTQPGVDGSGLKALVVDDTPFLRALTTSYLSGTGFQVDQAEDGQMALNLLKGGRYDLLVTDLGMPLLDGFELAAEVAATPNAEIPIIATTSSISSQLEQRCSAAGFVSCVSTIDKNRLLGVVATLQRC